MNDAPRSMSTRQLIADLLSQISDLVSIESRLVRAELSESSAAAFSGLGCLAGGFLTAFAGLIILLAGLAALLVRLGIAPDLACLIVAAVSIAIGAALSIFAIRTLRPANLAPARSLRQLSSLIGSS